MIFFNRLVLERVDAQVLKKAREFVARFDDHAASGEYKRHQVYALLIKEFPSVTKRKLARAIELACSA